MKYNNFKLLIKELSAKGILMDKETLERILTINYFDGNSIEIVKIILTSELDNRKFLNLLLQFVKDDSPTSFLFQSSILDILRDSKIRQNDYYVSAILSEVSFNKRQNLIRALKNNDVFSDLGMFNYLLEQEDEDIQRRMVAVLEFELGIKMFGEVQNSEKDNLDKQLKKVEQAIIEDEKLELEMVTKRFIDNPSKENMELLARHQKLLDRVLTNYQNTELSMDLPEVTGEGPKALIFTK